MDLGYSCRVKKMLIFCVITKRIDRLMNKLQRPNFLFSTYGKNCIIHVKESEIEISAVRLLCINESQKCASAEAY